MTTPRKTTLWWCLFAATSILYLLMLTQTLPQLRTLADGLSPLDLMAGGYDSAYLQHYFSQLGATGRHYYLWRQLPLDLLYPALFALTYGCLLRHLNGKAGWPAGKHLPLLPVAAAICDYLENFLLINMLLNHPDLSHGQAATASLLTIGKSLCGALTLLITALLLAHQAYTHHKTKR